MLILQHRAERTHPFNSARIVRKALNRCQLIAGRNRELANSELPIDHCAGLLYPSRNSVPLDSLPPCQQPGQLIILDGTWHHARTMYRDIPVLKTLPCYRLNPSHPSRFRIRAEPSPDAISTLEATIAALKILDPNIKGLEKLQAAFELMISRQLHELSSRNIVQQAHPAARRINT